MISVEQTADFKAIKGRVPLITAYDFYCFCAMGYTENNHRGSDKSLS